VTNIHVSADWHADFTGNAIDMPRPDCDLRLIVGDGAAPLTHALEIASKTFENDTVPTAYIPGNHDYYISSRYPQSFMQDELAKGRELAKARGIHLLCNDVLVINGTRILGTPLFTDMMAGDPSMSRKQKMLQSQRGYLDGRPTERNYHNDFREIRYGAPGSKNRFTPSQWLALHDEAMAFLRTELAKDWLGETVVATHMAPSIQSLAPGHRVHDWLYASTDCDDLFEHVDLWCHGHIHASKDYEIDGCRIIANPRGYPARGVFGAPPKGLGFENENWDPGLVVEVQPRCTRRMTP
jgi:UDP-2,3-diacylglucosamine pyrophosphatase LpxH